MAVKSRNEPGKLVLDIDNGDLEKLTTCMERWSFKDHQSLLRFAVSLLLVTEDCSLWIKTNGNQQPIAPADELLKPKGGENA